MGKYTAWKMEAAICDDTVEDVEFMEKHIKEYFMKKSIPYECNLYQSSKALWYDIEDGQAFDLLFLDIEMQELNGFELAAKIQPQRQAPCASLCEIHPDLAALLHAGGSELFRYRFHLPNHPKRLYFLRRLASRSSYI